MIANGSSNGIESSLFDPQLFTSEEKQKLRLELKIQENDFVFIFIGRLVSDKGVNELIEAFSQIQLTYSNSKLLLIGELENELDPLKAISLEKINNSNTILFLHYQKDVRPFLSISNCLVFPSYREGFPNVVMQAGAMGLPSIVSDINGCNEIISPNMNGLIIPTKNVEELIKSMKILISDKNKTELMASNSRSNIINNYEQKRVWKELLIEYKNLK